MPGQGSPPIHTTDMIGMFINIATGGPLKDMIVSIFTEMRAFLSRVLRISSQIIPSLAEVRVRMIISYVYMY